MKTIKAYWHSFKMWLCKDNVDFFQKEIRRLGLLLEENTNELYEEKKRFKALNESDVGIINNFHAQIQSQNNQFKAEKERLLFLDPEKIVTTDTITVDELGRPMQTKVLLIAGRQLSPEETKILKQEALYVKRTLWWDLVQNTVVNTAKLKMFEGSKDYQDMIGGKGILYAADVYRKILDRILE